VLRVTEELNRREHSDRILPVVPRQQVQLINADGRARNAGWFEQAHEARPAED
jgi:hypothetical protein